MLTLEAASEEPDRDKLAIEVSKALESIVYEAGKFTHRLLGAPPGENAKASERNPAAEKFVTETLPTVWRKTEMELFTYGDVQGTAVRMLDLINRNMAHTDATKWIEKITTALHGPPEKEVESPDPTDQEK